MVLVKMLSGLVGDAVESMWIGKAAGGGVKESFISSKAIPVNSSIS